MASSLETTNTRSAVGHQDISLTSSANIVSLNIAKSSDIIDKERQERKG